jgi:hypothetical protein
MGSIISYVPIISSFAIFGCLIKLAARLFKATKISWIQAFVFGGIWFLIGILPKILSFAFAFDISPLVLIPFNVFFLIASGSLFFKGRAKTKEGIPFGYAGGAKFSGFMIGLGLVVSLPLILLLAHFKPV